MWTLSNVYHPFPHPSFYHTLPQQRIVGTWPIQRQHGESGKDGRLEENGEFGSNESESLKVFKTVTKMLTVYEFLLQRDLDSNIKCCELFR